MSMSIFPIGRPIRLSSAAIRPYSSAAGSVSGQTINSDNTPPQSLGVPLPRAAVLDPVPKLRENRQADPDAVASRDGLTGPLIDTSSAMDVIAGGAGVE